MTTRIYKPFWPGQPLLNEPYLSAFTYSFPPAPKDKYSPTTPAFIDAATGKTILRGDVRRIALQLGHGFAHGLRKLVRPGWDGVLRRGDVVLLFSPNTIAFPLTIYGAVAAGLTVSTANSAYTPPELLHQLRDSHAKAIIVHPTLVPIALQTLALAGFSERDARARIIICDYQGLGGQVSGSKDGRREFVWVEDLMGTGTLAQEERFDGEDADATMFLCYSSGTTGKPKGVMTTHKNVVAVSRAIECAGEVFGPGDLHIQAGVLPFFHIFALSNTLFHGPSIGCPIVVMERFDPVLYPKYIEQYKISVSLIVPPIVIALLRHPAADKFDLRSLKTVISGAAPLGAPLAREFYEKMLKRGADVAVLQGYGLTETSPSVTLLPREWSTRKYGKAGALLASLEVRLVDDDGKDAPKGGPGELWVRGPVVMKGYLGNEAATRDSITPDKWFKTGDVAVVDDDGFYAIVDRKKELIKYKGFQVPPAELESALLEHPEVADAAVIGIEDKAEATELPRAYVVHVKPSTIPTPEDKAAFAEKIQAWMRQRVARHKHLRGGCIVIDAIPKSAAGKILRKDLRALAAKEVTSAQAGSPGKAKL